MKIGILTHHYVKNYGAFLQMKGMYETLQRLYPEAEVTVINYVNQKHWRRNIIHILHFRPGVDTLSTYVEKIRQLRTFTKYERSIPRTRPVKTAKEIIDLKLDLIVLGSDEIWNLCGSGYHPLKFGTGLENQRTIAYAPSVGAVTEETAVPEDVLSGLKHLDRISGRDVESLKFVERACGRKAEKMLDPTFLYNFDTDIERENIKPKPYRYILIYDCKLTEPMVKQLQEYAQAKKDLLDGKRVLFSGTPCQIAGLKQYLKKDYENLLTVDIICHGVPSKRFFQSFMEDYGKKLGGTITEFYFRDKSKGQGMITRSVYKNKHGERQEKVITGNLLSYVNLFLRSFTYRKNCYSCPFASEKRVGDLTLGDFWGFHEEYPSYDEKQGLSNGKGVSCILVNTNQGKVALEQCESQFVLMTSDFEKVARHNDQLHSPSKYSPKREQILELYQKEGYEAVDRYFHKNYKKDILKYTVSGMLPKGLKRNIKKMAGKIKNK